MPLPNRVLRDYTRTDVLALKPNQMGVYWILKAHGVVIYIGRGDIRERMLAHIGGDNECITVHAPTRWGSSVRDKHVQLEKKLILEYDPICNKQVG